MVNSYNFHVLETFFQIYYKCSTEGCENFQEVSAEDVLIIEQVIQSVSAVDSLTAKIRYFTISLCYKLFF